MKMEVNLEQRLEQRMMLTQQIIQSLELLQLPIMELRELIMEELSENPTVELTQDIDEHSDEEPPEPIEQRRDGKQSEKLDILDDFEAIQEGETSYEKHYYNEEAAEKRYDMFQNIEAKPQNLRDYLYSQLTLMEVSDEIKTIGEYIIYNNINDNGYLKFTSEETPASSTGQLPALTQEEFSDKILKEIAVSLKDKFPNLTREELIDKIKVVLDIIRKLEPMGVGARNMKECLLLQLFEDDPHYEVKRKLINQYLEDIGQKQLSKISQETGIDIEELKIIVAEISHLNPKPGATFSADKVPSVYPEVIVKEIDNNYEVILEDSYLPPIIINKKCQEMLKNKNLPSEERNFIRKKLTSGKWIISAIEQRKMTLHKIANEIVGYQKDFLEKGIEYLKPLTMQQVANTIGMHVSTVSRAVSNKYIDTPRGIFNMKFFFASAADVNDGNPHRSTRLNLLSKMQDIIENEDKKKPISDSEIAEILNKDGLKIMRRTITKIREELGISSSRLRKQG